MSKKNEEAENQGTRELETQNVKVEQTSRTYCSIEIHGVTLKISKAEFAAVKQFKGWATGKKVERTEFIEALKAFYGARTGGV